MRRLPEGWGRRLVGGVALAAIGFGVAVLLDFDPQPLPYVVWSVVVLALVFLVVDTVEAPVAVWHHGLPASRDRADEATSDLRVLTSHQQADQPTDALAHRLAALARGRDPDLADEVERELADLRRIPPATIDRVLTRIEEHRDRA